MNCKLSLMVFVCVAAALLAGTACSSETADEVRRLREDEKDYEAAIALAQQFLDGYPQLDVERQAVQFELGRAQYGAKDYAAALASLRGLVGDYSVTSLDKTAESFVVDDAQFYVGVIEHYFGDRAKGIEGYKNAIADFPASNRRAHALALLAGVYEQDGDAAKALTRFEQLVKEHPQSQQAPEAQLHVGHLLREGGNLNESIAAFERVAKEWPESKYAPSGLLNVNRALMAQELTSAERAQNGEQIRENEDAIKANVQLLLKNYPDSHEIAQAMEDVINFYSSPLHGQRDASSWAKARAAAAWLRENLPGTRQGMRAICDLAVVEGGQHPDEALVQLDFLIDTARIAKDDSLVFDARFAKARVLKQAGRKDEAKEIFEDLLELASDEHLADEIRISLIRLKPREQRMAAYEGLADDETRHTDIRTMALLSMALLHMTEERYEDALPIVERVIAEFPETLNARTAEGMRDQLRELMEVPIHKRGNYRPE